MKTQVSLWITAAMFVGTLGSLTAFAKPASTAVSKKPVEVTGCLQQGPTAKEYLLQSADGTVWGINETDMLMNNYVGHTVTIAGDSTPPTKSERSAGGAQHYLRAYDLVVDSNTCNK
jgi:hypothetical protein